MTGTRLYGIWCGMVSRCENKNDYHYPNWGGAGVRVYPEWRNDSGMFFKWALDHGYRDELSLDRYPDPNGNYCPENCRWATPKQQQRNRRDNHLIEWQEEKKTAIERAEITGISVNTINARARSGWSGEEVLTTTTNKDRYKRTRKLA